MKAIQQARKLYIQYHCHKPFFQEIKKAEMKNDIQLLITIATKEVPFKELFENIWMLDILKSALKRTANENMDVMVLERAYRGMEKYFLLLVQQPWKTEFREIKMYGGFYKTRIKSVIPDCEHIFERAGYMVSPDQSTMVYRTPKDKHFLLLLAFDCRVSQMECKAIADHYSRIKGLPPTLKDVVSNIVNDDHSQDKPAFRHNLIQKYGLIEDIPSSSHVYAPPVIPMREPILNSSNMRQNVRLENKPYNPSDNYQFLPEQSFSQRPSQWSGDQSSSVLPRPQLTPSGVAPEPFVYIHNMTHEIIPELPQGTMEDHMLETLKLVNRQDTPKQQVPVNWKNIARLNQSNPNVSVTSLYSGRSSLPGNIVMQRNVKHEPSIDEGIETDMSTSKSFSLVSKFGSIGGPQVIPGKPANSFQQISLDPGYRTGNPDSIYSQLSTNMMPNLQQQIYHPPNLSIDSTVPVMHRKVSLSRQNAAPAQVPSRTLKPTQNSEEYSLYDKMYLHDVSHTRPHPVAKTQSDVSQSQPSGYLTLSQTPETEYILQTRERPAVYKSSSLKIGSTSLSNQVTTPRMARSMDMTTFWECPSCSKLNMSPNTVCSSCSYIYITGVAQSK